MTRRVLVLSASVGAGHVAAGQALEQAFRSRPDVEVLHQDALKLTNKAYRTVYDDMYQFLVKRFPLLVGWSYDSADLPFAGEEFPRKLWDMANSQPIVRFVQEYNPDIVACTHFMPAGIVSQMLALDMLDATLSVVTTDYDFQGLWLNQMFNRYFVAREETRERLIAIGLDPARVTISGIPVNPEFGRPVDREAVLARYELRGDRPIVMISAGSVGGGPARDLVAQSLELRHDAQVVVVCGSNEQLRRDVEAITYRHAERFRVLGFTDDMVNLVRVATLFVGKSGGLSASECMAAGTPMVINTPTPGQEERNSDYLLEEGAAIRCNYVQTFAYKIDRVLEDAERLERLRANARRIGRPDASAVIAETLLNERLRPVRFARSEQAEIAEASEHPSEPLLEQPNRVVALYDDEIGTLLGAMNESAFRSLSRQPRRSDDSPRVTTLSLDDIQNGHALGLDATLLRELGERIRARGPLRVRWSRI